MAQACNHIFQWIKVGGSGVQDQHMLYENLSSKEEANTGPVAQVVLCTPNIPKALVCIT